MACRSGADRFRPARFSKKTSIDMADRKGELFLRVLPGIDDEQGDAALGDLRLMVVDLGGAEAAGDGIPHQRRPARAHDGRGGLADLLPEGVEGSEVPLHRFTQLTRGAAAAGGG